jgi:hypothetical protein
MRNPGANPRFALTRQLRVAAVALGAAAAFGVGCTPYRIEYHQRPEFYQDASAEKLPDEWIAPDGTLVKFTTGPLPSEQEALAARASGRTREVDRDGDGEPDEAEPTPLWEPHDDGTVTMRAFLPEHVIGALMTSLREERYGEFYDQLVASATRTAFDASAKGEGRKAFILWCAKHRRDVMATLNRMGFGYLSPDVVLRKTGPNSFAVGFTPRVAQQFKFTELNVEYEDGMCRLVTIK